MVGKAFAWKAVTDSALTAELGRSFQRGITSMKKETLYAFIVQRHKKENIGLSFMSVLIMTS